MELIHLLRRSSLYALVLFTGLSLAGCASGGIFGDGRDDDYEDDYEYDRGSSDEISEVRGRVERIDTRDEIIYVEPSAVYRTDLRNEDDELELHYDASTRVEYEGRSYEPRDLEPGDRIVAEVDDTGRELRAREIEVTYDVTSGDDRTTDYDRDDDDYDRDDDRDADYDRDDDRYDRDDDRYDDDRDDADVAELRGKVRWLDADRRVLEIEDASWGWGSRGDREDVVEVHYDTNTIVEFEGKRYQPTNLERGDQVQVEVRDVGSRYVADEILVVASVRD